MRCVLALTAACCTWNLAIAWVAEKETTYVDLQSKANQKLADDFSPTTEGNNLAKLPKGEQTFEGIRFKIDEGLIQLGSKLKKEKPEKVQGITVHKPLAKLHILQATEFGSSPEGDERHVPDDTIIAQYVVNYADKSVEVIEVVYGKDVRDWWYFDSSKSDLTRGKIAWKGNNDFAMNFGAMIRLYMTTWENPKPDKRITSIDYVATSETAAAPFCVAITAEGK